MMSHGTCGYISATSPRSGILKLFGSSLQIAFSVDTSIQLPSANPALSGTEPSITAIVRKLSPLPENSKWASISGRHMSERREEPQLQSHITSGVLSAYDLRQPSGLELSVPGCSMLVPMHDIHQRRAGRLHHLSR